MKVFLDNELVPSGQLTIPKDGQGKSILQVGESKPIMVWVYMSQTFNEDFVEKTYICYRRKPVDFSKGNTTKVTVKNGKAKKRN